ncbi:thioesterase-like superfamily-domain-containing protein [Scheffersomyces coipomensis]|uniref:thioesterase-like superfamily-domain-containing protein n=1 Tax=Scheffersomyces coipomensis TaxID=1788519 RepID=UPI00315D35BD
MPNYEPNQVVDVQEEFGVIETGPNKFRSKRPLTKPVPQARGAYGGNVAAQAVIVALRTSPPDFKPHCLHSYFVKPVSSSELMDWEVDIISKGKNFCNRSVKGFQNGEIKYIANISLTRKNSNKIAQAKYDDFVKRQEEKGDDEDEDEDGEIIQKPFGFQTPYHPWFNNRNLDEIEVDPRGYEVLVYHKIIPELLDLKLTPEEEKVPVAQRRLAFYAKWGIENEQGYNQPLTNVNQDYQYAGLAVLSDTLFLTRLARVMRLEDVDLENMVHYFSVSLDHVVYFHDDDFDVTKWMGVTFKAARFANKRVVMEGELYNDKGVHVATFVQEGLVHLNGLEAGAKL